MRKIRVDIIFIGFTIYFFVPARDMIFRDFVGLVNVVRVLEYKIGKNAKTCRVIL